VHAGVLARHTVEVEGADDPRGVVVRRRMGFLGHSDAMRYALRQYAEQVGFDTVKLKPPRRPKR
jgi:hypothetical protein